MKLENFHLIYNNYDFVAEGIPAKSYGGKMILQDKNGRIEVMIDNNDVNRIMEILAESVANKVTSMAQTVTANSIRVAAVSNALPYDGDVRMSEIVPMSADNIPF